MNMKTPLLNKIAAVGDVPVMGINPTIGPLIRAGLLAGVGAIADSEYPEAGVMRGAALGAGPGLLGSIASTGARLHRMYQLIQEDR